MVRSNSEWSQVWDNFLLSEHPDAGFMQSSWWVDLMCRYGWGYFDAFYMEQEPEILGGAKVLAKSFDENKSFFYIPDGLVLSENPEEGAYQFEMLMGHLKELSVNYEGGVVSHLRLEHRWTAVPEYVQGFVPFSGWMEPRTTSYIKLTASEQELLQQMNYNGRSRVRSAIKKGVTVVDDSSEKAVEDFLQLYLGTMLRKEKQYVNSDFHRDLITAVSSRNAGSLYFAEYQGQRIATALVVFWGERATYFFAGSSYEHRKLAAPYLLNYEIMLSAKQCGCKYYDLYGVAPVDQPEHEWAGISIFKRNLGGEYIDFGPALDLVFDEQGYREYLNSTQQ